jgi:ribosomal-protein-alanine N-acetyltransferase
MKTKMPGELKVDDLILRKLCVDDRQRIYEIRSNQDIKEYLDRPICKTLEEADSFITKINKGIDKGDYYYWGITIANENEVIGTICIWNISEDKKREILVLNCCPIIKEKE